MFRQYVRSGRESLEHLKNYEEIARRVKEIVGEKYGGVRVFVFGSVLKGRVTASSDIDLLIVSDEIAGSRDEAARLKASVLKRIGLGVPLEIHVATEKEFKWYLKFIDELKEID
jgi:predicted nucleotidyltransferase